jgi:hypothetical protein
MLVVKSILSGEFTISSPQRLRKRLSGNSNANNSNTTKPPLPPGKQQQQSSSAASHQSSSQVTTLEDDSFFLNPNQEDTMSDTSDFSPGSVAAGDSFVLAIDWDSTDVRICSPVVAVSGNTKVDVDGDDQINNHTTTPNGLNESLEDPYLQPVEVIRKRLLSSSSVAAPQTKTNATATTAAATERRGMRRMLPAPRKKFQHTPSARSLGSFDMPTAPIHQTFNFLQDCADEPSDAAGKALTIPRQTNFDASQISHVAVSDDEEEEEEEEGHVDVSFAIPSSGPILTTPKSSLSSSTKRMQIAQLQASETKAAMKHLQTQSISRTRQVRLAKLYLQLASVELKLHQYPCAINSYFQAAAVYRHFALYTALATSLDKAAAAYCQAYQHGMMDIIHQQHPQSRFFRCLYEAAALRKQELGPWHVDTVDSLQHLAHLCLLTGQASKAATYYLEVVHVRNAIFGCEHPSLAVSAHCLGNAYLQSHDTSSAEQWYALAMQVYNQMALPDDNPAVARLLSDRKRLERVDRWISKEDPADDENLLFEL